MLETNNYANVIQVGNSSGLRLTKQDKDQLHLRNGDKLIKTISKDGSKITFRKPKEISKITRKQISRIFREDRNGIKALK